MLGLFLYVQSRVFESLEFVSFVGAKVAFAPVPHVNCKPMIHLMLGGCQNVISMLVSIWGRILMATKILDHTSDNLPIHPLQLFERRS